MKRQARRMGALEQNDERRGSGNRKVGAPKCRAFPLCVRNKRELAINGEDLEKIYLIEIKTVSLFFVAGCEKTRGRKMKVTSIMLLKTNGGKMSEIDLSIILLKNKLVIVSFPLCS
jgi:hypothetical protein